MILFILLLLNNSHFLPLALLRLHALFYHLRTTQYLKYHESLKIIATIDCIWPIFLIIHGMLNLTYKIEMVQNVQIFQLVLVVKLDETAKKHFGKVSFWPAEYRNRPPIVPLIFNFKNFGEF